MPALLSIRVDGTLYARQMDKRAYISVIGAGECTDEEAATAETVGRELARRGAVLVCGGKGGVMEAACKGAKSAGGLTIGILPDLDRAQANPYVDIPIVTGLGSARNSIVVLSGQAVIAIGGAYGTLSEIAFAGLYSRVVVGLGTWKAQLPGSDTLVVIEASSPAEAVSIAIGAAGPTG
jgi:uncharacterized protein (TIGR00725 family)